MSRKAFKEGFVDGFTAPFAFFSEKHSDVERYQTSVGRAWEDVGVAFQGVMRKQGAIVGKERDKGRQRSERAA